jgi:hypothetical protein
MIKETDQHEKAEMDPVKTGVVCIIKLEKNNYRRGLTRRFRWIFQTLRVFKAIEFNVGLFLFCLIVEVLLCAVII